MLVPGPQSAPVHHQHDAGQRRRLGTRAGRPSTWRGAVAGINRWDEAAASRRLRAYRPAPCFQEFALALAAEPGPAGPVQTLLPLPAQGVFQQFRSGPMP